MIQKKSPYSLHPAAFKKKKDCSPLSSVPYSIKGFVCLAITMLLLIVIPVYASAQKTVNIFDKLRTDDADQPWQIEAEEISYDDKELQYIAKGNVIITQADKQLFADYVRFDRQTMRAQAQGNVEVTVGNDILTGSSMDIDLENQTGTIIDGYIFLRENNFHIKGEKIQKLGENTYAVENASVTTCEGDPPDWLITAKSLKVTVEGYGVLKHAALKTKNIPILYSPYLWFPAKIKRQSGFLFPQFGTSDRRGLFYIQPFFWAISESSDATFYAHYMGERGFKPGLEYRYILSELSKGTLQFDYLDDRKVDDGTGDSSEKYGFGDDAVLRPNSDRYWFRNSHYQALPHEFYAKLNLDIVSDQDYLREFKHGLTGYFETVNYFNDNFNRVFNDYANPVRENNLNLNRIWSSYSLNAEAFWFDNVINRRFEDTDTTLQKLPFISFDAAKQRILGSSFYYDLASQYTYFYRQDDDKGHRMDIYPRFYLPYQFENYFTFEPSIGLRETVWYVNPDEDISGSFADDDKRFNRQFYDIKIGLTSEISRVFEVNTGKVERIKHEILPEIFYDFVPHQDQSELPEFDDIDRIEKKNLLTYSITNLFVWRAVKDTMGEESDGLTNYHYRQFGRLKLEQSYDVNEAREDDPVTGKRRPFSPIRAELDVNLNRYLTLDADTAWDVYEHEFSSANIAVAATDIHNNELSVEYRFTDNQTESFYTKGRLRISNNLTAFGQYERNILDDVRVSTIVGLLYESQCWGIEVSYIDEPDNRTFEFSINLFGLGDFGGEYGVN